MLLKLQFSFKIFSDDGIKVNKPKYLLTRSQLMIVNQLTLKNAAVDPPPTAPYLIFCCLKFGSYVYIVLGIKI